MGSFVKENTFSNGTAYKNSTFIITNGLMLLFHLNPMLCAYLTVLKIRHCCGLIFGKVLQCSKNNNSLEKMLPLLPTVKYGAVNPTKFSHAFSTKTYTVV
jgi:hypothetical protein